MKSMNKALVAAALAATLPAFGDDVATLEGKLLSDILAKVDEVNPVDAATGARKYVSFAMISDIHKCKRVAGDDDATNPDTTYWYGSAGCLTEAEQSIRLLGMVATNAGLDAVINGGDLSTAPIYNGGAQDRGLTEAEYTNEIWNVKAMFDRHLSADVPLFTIDGNHERNYSLNGADMHMSDEAWAYVQTNFNTSAAAARARGVGVTYHRDLASAKLGDSTGRFTGNSFHLDFRRLLASGGPNVRIACVSLYDAAAGGESQYRVYDAAQFYDAGGNLLDAELTPENTVMGMVAHGAEEKVRGESGRGAAGTLQCGFMNGYSNPASQSGPWNLGTHKGKGFFGLVAAHFHFTNEKEITNNYDTQANPGNTVYASAVSVASAYAVNCPSKPKSHELGTETAYHFSVFVVDTDANRLREIRVGGWSGTYPNPHEDPVVQLHDFNIRTHLADPPDPAAPVIGGVAVAPGVTNATVSGTITSVGTDATACDVYLALGPSADALGAAEKIAEGATGSFSHVVSGLAPETSFFFELTVSNNAASPLGAAASGSFTTLAAPVEPPEGALVPGETAAGTRQTIQDAIDAAAAMSPAGTVVLGEGLFDIDEQLMVTNGVKLLGQGWTNTTVRFVGSAGASNRVMTVSGGSVVGHLAMTGGKVNHNAGAGGGAIVDGDGTITWCCVTNNWSQRNFGGGVFVVGGGTVRIDHTIVAGNSAGTALLDGSGGGICIRGWDGLRVEIESCLVYGNVVGADGRTSPGGGIYVGVRDARTDRITTVIRNTTVADNQVLGSGLGGGLYVDQADTTLVNCLFSDNAADAGDGNVAVAAAVAEAVAAKTSNCLFGNGTTVFGANPVGIAGSAGFVAAAAGDYHLVDTSLVMDKGADYAGLGTDLDGRAYAWPPSIGCYEYGSGVRPNEWDVPGPNGGGIKGVDDGNGGTYVTFTSIARTNAVLTVVFRAAKVVADGGVYGLVCKENLADAATFKLPALLTDGADETLGILTATLEAGTDNPTLFAVGIGPAEE